MFNSPFVIFWLSKKILLDFNLVLSCNYQINWINMFTQPKATLTVTGLEAQVWISLKSDLSAMVVYSTYQIWCYQSVWTDNTRAAVSWPHYKIRS